ncbi:MAG: DUF2339 domain-containing protein [Planctomycetota bacterium]|jgi:uncharacterized membrane protein
MAEVLGGLLLLALVLALAVGAVLGLVTFIIAIRDRGRQAEQAIRLKSLQERVKYLEERLEPVEEPARPESTSAPPHPEPVPVERASAVPSAKDTAARERLGTLGTDWARLEEALGRRWMTWAGVVALFLAAGFFVKYAFDAGWVGPAARVILGIVAGIALLTVGEIAVRRRMAALGQGLMGGGLAILYVSLFASFSLYHLVPQPIAFGAMVLVTIAGMLLAVSHDALPVSFVALLGGVLTPVLLSTGTDRRDTLFSYLLVLDLGVLGIALFRRWRYLDLLAFVGTAVLFAGWFLKFYDEPAMMPALLWLGAFYLVFLLLPFVHHFRRRTEISVERFGMAMANALLAFGCAYRMLHAGHRHALGFIALGMAVCYIALAAQTRRRIPTDERGVFGFVALAVLLATIAVPLRLRVNGITLAWAAEAPVLLYLGWLYRYRPLRNWAFAVLALVLIRLFAVHWPLHEGPFTLIWNRQFWTAMCVPLAAAAFSVVHEWHGLRLSDTDRALKRIGAVGGGLLALVLLHAELSLWFDYSGRAYLGKCILPLVWATGATGFLGMGFWFRSAHARWAGFVALVLGAVLAARTYGQAAPGSYVVLLNLRFIAGLAVALAAFVYTALLNRYRRMWRRNQGRLARATWWMGIAGPLALLSAEAYRYCLSAVAETERARWMALMSLSIVWGVYALAMLAVGFWRRSQPLRLAALGLFGAAAVKLVSVDIPGLEQIYRILSLLVVGLLMVGAAYLYNHIESRLEELLGAQQ